jgi:hypothetical protein
VVKVVDAESDANDASKVLHAPEESGCTSAHPEGVAPVWISSLTSGQSRSLRPWLVSTSMSKTPSLLDRYQPRVHDGLDRVIRRPHGEPYRRDASHHIRLDIAEPVESRFREALLHSRNLVFLDSYSFCTSKTEPNGS